MGVTIYFFLQPLNFAESSLNDFGQTCHEECLRVKLNNTPFPEKVPYPVHAWHLYISKAQKH